ncbi:hypothetical protein ACHAWU_004128 [Discostella pseudostelligera]|uniref:Uncharacterized protein n=1 Tax=Discostella pseudostelligera TaxID=259834 RepID=A0ABD3MQT6_9STRA
MSSSKEDGAAKRRGDHHHRHRRRHRDDEEDDAAADDDAGSRLTEKEEQLYAKAKEFLKRKEVENDNDLEEEARRRRHHHRHHSRKHHDHDRHRHRADEKGKGHRHRHSRRSDEDEDDDSSEDRNSHRHRKEHKKKHKRSRHHHHSRRRDDDNDDDDDKGGNSRHHKKMKQKHTHYTGDEAFKNKASPIDTAFQQQLFPLGNILRKPPSDDKKLDAESDYFSHNVHLRLYLFRRYRIYFEDLTSSESHCAFTEFTKLYNSGMLEEAYYTTLPQEAIDQCSRTKHKWKFRTNQLEEQSLELVRAGVKKQTEYSSATTPSAATTVGISATMREVAPTSQGNTTTNNREQHVDHAQTSASRRHTDRAHMERIKLANEEIHGVQSGKADTGWERMREKKMERSEKLHGAHRDRESEGWELNDDDIYGTSAGGGGKRRGGGGGDVSFEEALAKERQYRERKEAETIARREGLLEKEAERQKKMFEALGLSGLMKPGEKITIAPRNDGHR